MKKILVYDSKDVSKVKKVLEANQLFRNSDKIIKINDKFEFYTNTNDESLIRNLIKDVDIDLSDYETKDVNEKNTAPKLESLIKIILSDNDIILPRALNQYIPKKWSIYQPMILFKSGTFDSPVWRDAIFNHINEDKFYSDLLNFFPLITHIAINKPIIETDVMRRPFNIIPIFGDFGPEPTTQRYENPTCDDFEQAFWCNVIQNGITQIWSPQYTMFSRGNIKEKTRILQSYTNFNKNDNDHDNCVVDLYAGIGYFTLSYLKKGADLLFCWELNPWSIEGLVRGVSKNGYKYRLLKHNEEYSGAQLQKDRSLGVKVIIFEESNEFANERFDKLNMKFNVNHINLGLLPSSTLSWPITGKIIHDVSYNELVTVHIHENVHINAFDEFKLKILQYFIHELKNDFKYEIIHLEKVKTFAPDVWHIVVDLEIRRISKVE